MKMHSKVWDRAEQSLCSMISSPDISHSPSKAKGIGNGEQGRGKASIWLIWVCLLYSEIGPMALIYPSSWEKALPSSNQCLSFNRQWAVADLELQSLSCAAAETDFAIPMPSEHEEWLLGLAPCWAGVRSVPCCWGCQMLGVPWCWHPPSHCSVLISPCPRDHAISTAGWLQAHMSL